MKFVSTQFAFFLSRGETRRNVGALLRYLAFLAVVITVFSVVFHVVMEREGRFA